MTHASQSYPLGVFIGVGGIRRYLRPESHVFPLVELPKELNPFRSEHVRIFAKVIPNIKCYAAVSMLDDARDSGRLEGVHTLVEATSGNMGLMLATLAPIYGISRVITIVPRDLAQGKAEALRIAGADVMTDDHPFLEGLGASAIIKARRLGEKKSGYLNLGQYDNKANPGGIEKWLAPEMDRQTGGSLTVIVTALGTTGTAVGLRNYFKKRLRGKDSKPVRIIGAYCKAEHAVPGVRTLERLGEVGFDWQKAVDAPIAVETKESFKSSLDLFQAGIMAGPSSGTARVALHRYLEARLAAGTQDDIRDDKTKAVNAAFICADMQYVYADKYSTHLKPEQLLRQTHAQSAS